MGDHGCAIKLPEAEPPRELRPPKNRPRLRDGSLMPFPATLIRVHASRLVQKFEARPIAANRAWIFCAIT